MPTPDPIRGLAGSPVRSEAALSASGAGPLLPASLGASLLLGCRRWAETLAVPIDDLAVDITTEHAVLCAASSRAHAPSGPARIRIELRVQSSQPKARVRAVIDTALRLNTALASISREVEWVFLVHIDDSGPSPKPS